MDSFREWATFYYDAFLYVTKQDVNALRSPNHPPLVNSPPICKAVSKKRRSAEAEETKENKLVDSKTMKTKKSKRLDRQHLYDIIVANEIKTDLELCHLAKVHRGNLEVFHSVYLKFCPKRTHFSMQGMIARTEHAVMHFNSLAAAPYATTKSGKDSVKHQYSKITKSWVIKKLKRKSDRKYVAELMKEVIWLKESGEKVSLPNFAVPKNIAPIQKPDKEQSLKEIKSRFK